MRTFSRLLIFSGFLVLVSSGFRWLFPLFQGVNVVPLLLFFLVDRENDSRALIMGGVAGVLTAFLSAGPGAVWFLQYLAEAWCVGRLLRNQPRSGYMQFFLIWVVMGIDLGMDFLFREVLEYPLKTQLLEDWLVADGVAGGFGMVVLLGHRFGKAGRFRSPKHHGIGIPFS